MARRFDILDTNTRQYRPYNSVERQITVRLISPSDNSDPLTYFLDSVNDLFEHALRYVDDSEMVGITIQNKVNQNDKPIEITFRWKDRLSGDVIWSVFETVSQSNSRFNALDTLVVIVHSVKLPVGFVKRLLKSRGRPLAVMAHLKRSIVEVKAKENSLAPAPVIAIARADNAPNYKAYRKVRKIGQAVQTLLKTTGIDPFTRGGIAELIRFQEHIREYKTVVYNGLSCDDILFEGQVDSSKT